MSCNFLKISMTMTVMVLFIQGSNAVLTFALSNTTLAENSPPLTSVQDLDATDGTDPVTYRLVGTSNEFFINQTAKQLQVKAGAVLNFESSTKAYTITITATDDAATPLVANATFTVTLTDVNEAPSFPSNPYNFNVNMGAGEGTAIGSVIATDPDAGVNGQLTYAIVAGNNFTTFAISTAIGNISVASTKTVNLTSYSLTVTATDGGSPKLTGATMVSITMPPGATTNCVGFLLLLGIC